jgi:hypothetical protein
MTRSLTRGRALARLLLIVSMFTALTAVVLVVTSLI